MNNEAITPVLVESKIFLIRGRQVMVDRDLAELYGVETKVINQAVKRNIERFLEQDRKINQIIQVLNNLIEEPKPGRKIGFVNGESF
ncbi:MAG: ORF6N domain-containing protein [Treponema sp.]|nr:ORF6N domain-containing protein [Treponema sp.]